MLVLEELPREMIFTARRPPRWNPTAYSTFLPHVALEKYLLPDHWPDLIYPLDEWPDEIEVIEPPARLLLFRLTVCADIRLRPGDLIGINRRWFRLYRVREERAAMGHKVVTLELYYPEGTSAGGVGPG